MTRYTGNPQTKENCRKSCIIHALANFSLSVPNNNLASMNDQGESKNQARKVKKIKN